MSWKDVAAGVLQAAEAHLWGALGDNVEEVAQLLNRSPHFLDKVASAVLQAYRDETNQTTLSRAHEIMGGDFFGLNDSRMLGVSHNREIAAALSFVPWSEDVLRSVSETHLLVAFPGGSIAAFSTRLSQQYHFQGVKLDTTVPELPHLTQKEPPAWWLVPKSAHPDYQPVEEGLVPIPLMVQFYTIIAYYIKREQQLYPNVSMLVADEILLTLTKQGVVVRKADNEVKDVVSIFGYRGSLN